MSAKSLYIMGTIQQIISDITIKDTKTDINVEQMMFKV